MHMAASSRRWPHMHVGGGLPATPSHRLSQNVFTRLPSLATILLLLTTRPALGLQARSGTFAIVDSTAARANDPRSFSVRTLAGNAAWRLELDPTDWRTKWTVRLSMSPPDSGMIIIRWATADRPQPGAYQVKRIGIGYSHADARFVTVSFLAREGGTVQEYSVGQPSRVVVSNADSGIVTGSIAYIADRYVDDRASGGSGSWAVRRGGGSFQATAGPPVRQPSMTAALQERILWGALDVFAVTWIGAINGDGPADSTKTVAKARAFLEARWSEALIIDSLATNTQGFYVRAHGKIIPIVCVVTEHDSAPRCTPPRGGMLDFANVTASIRPRSAGHDGPR